jgi:hypothetical protein
MSTNYSVSSELACFEGNGFSDSPRWTM